MRAGPRRGPLASEGRGSGLVAGLRDGSDNVLDRNAFDVVVDLDAGGGEMDLHVLDTLQASDLLLDLGHAGGEGESFGPQVGVGGGRVGSGRAWGREGGWGVVWKRREFAVMIEDV